MSESPPAGLRRVLGLRALTIYGIGDILGAGIYALIGKGRRCRRARELALFRQRTLRRRPHGVKLCRAGQPLPAQRQRGLLRPPSLAVQGARTVRGLAGFLFRRRFNRDGRARVRGLRPASLIPGASGDVLLLSFLLLIGGINYLGIRQSSLVNMVCTAVEVSGLLVVVYAGWSFLRGGIANELAAPAPHASWPDIATGSVLAFYAFIGFEDMVNVAEEVKSPRKTLPAAILIALVVADVSTWW